MDKAREAAVFALERTRRDGAWSSALSDAMKTKYNLDSRSLSLAVSISLGVLQSTALLDYYIDLNSKSASKIEPKVRDIMRSGAYQLIFMDKIPASAAVNEHFESWELCKLADEPAEGGRIFHNLAPHLDDVEFLFHAVG